MKTTKEKVLDIVKRTGQKLKITFDGPESVNFRKVRNENGYHIYFRSVNVKGSEEILEEIWEIKNNIKKISTGKSKLAITLKEFGASRVEFLGGCASWGASVNVFVK